MGDKFNCVVPLMLLMLSQTPFFWVSASGMGLLTILVLLLPAVCLALPVTGRRVGSLLPFDNPKKPEDMSKVFLEMASKKKNKKAGFWPVVNDEGNLMPNPYRNQNPDPQNLVTFPLSRPAHSSLLDVTDFVFLYSSASSTALTPVSNP